MEANKLQVVPRPIPGCHLIQLLCEGPCGYGLLDGAGAGSTRVPREPQSLSLHNTRAPSRHLTCDALFRVWYAGDGQDTVAHREVTLFAYMTVAV